MKKKIICTALATAMLLSTNASAAPWQMRLNQLIFDSEIDLVAENEVKRINYFDIIREFFLKWVGK